MMKQKIKLNHYAIKASLHLAAMDAAFQRMKVIKTYIQLELDFA